MFFSNLFFRLRILRCITFFILILSLLHFVSASLTVQSQFKLKNSVPYIDNINIYVINNKDVVREYGFDNIKAHYDDKLKISLLVGDVNGVKDMIYSGGVFVRIFDADSNIIVDNIPLAVEKVINDTSVIYSVLIPVDSLTLISKASLQSENASGYNPVYDYHVEFELKDFDDVAKWKGNFSLTILNEHYAESDHKSALTGHVVKTPSQKLNDDKRTNKQFLNNLNSTLNENNSLAPTVNHNADPVSLRFNLFYKIINFLRGMFT